MSSIPKIIFQTWKTHEVPDKWKPSLESIRQFAPDWNYMLYSDEDNRAFIQKHFPDFLSYYDSFPYPIMRADAIRYAFLYVNGGVYMDLDMELLQPLDKYLQGGDLFLVHSSNTDTCFTNSFMASAPGKKLWLDLIEHMKRPPSWWIPGKHLYVMHSTGPFALSNVVAKSKESYSVIPKYAFPCSVCDLENENNKCWQNPDALLKPLEGGSWNSWDSKLYNHLLCHWKVMLFTLVVVIVLIFALVYLVR